MCVQFLVYSVQSLCGANNKLCTDFYVSNWKEKMKMLSRLMVPIQALLMLQPECILQIKVLPEEEVQQTLCFF